MRSYPDKVGKTKYVYTIAIIIYFVNQTFSNYLNEASTSFFFVHLNCMTTENLTKRERVGSFEVQK